MNPSTKTHIFLCVFYFGSFLLFMSIICILKVRFVSFLWLSDYYWLFLSDFVCEKVFGCHARRRHCWLELPLKLKFCNFLKIIWGIKNLKQNSIVTENMFEMYKQVTMTTHISFTSIQLKISSCKNMKLKSLDNKIESKIASYTHRMNERNISITFSIIERFMHVYKHGMLNRQSMTKRE